ncbi:hypothetical protein EYF80_063837 [Liparis tanakae]|uniref:Uncharacterized protein n=1 Tax=Liparis tanakae TaxID=230148 RepID=A0A4Z2EBA2_9TELE|nr:hypothetical protein EYF80_063837 [Liparis tanakae]
MRTSETLRDLETLRGSFKPSRVDSSAPVSLLHTPGLLTQLMTHLGALTRSSSLKKFKDEGLRPDASDSLTANEDVKGKP